MELESKKQILKKLIKDSELLTFLEQNKQLSLLGCGLNPNA